MYTQLGTQKLVANDALISVHFGDTDASADAVICFTCELAVIAACLRPLEIDGPEEEEARDDGGREMA